MKKWMMIPALAGVLIIGGVAVAGNAGHSFAATSKGLVTMDEAKAIAVKSVGGTVTGIELDREASGDIYEVEVKSKGFEYDLDIDAKTGKILRTDKDDNDDDDFDNDDSDDKVIVADGKFITEKAAVEIALKQAKGTVTEVKLDEDDGRVVYEIEIQDGKYDYDFDIDAISGKVLKFEKDLDDNDNDND
ncbi:PepSY domain-containing protein [Sporosarcina sp. E16_3]|uniref:PepSY domain-containing protein n=1 Tax=Sporosarcina sp. E16_3 TaxID=2789293 RepID=UPI001A91A3BA|nr:PepSY domain-containing protein [Sporosarcina sp. E16_3]MBO0601205.1 PepSY domain-containing protein [Sporosarcina sp. E16_3]